MTPSAEHNAVRALAGQPTHVAKQNGSWFDPNTWEGGKVPGNNAKVHIKQGVSVSYDNKSDARIFTLNVEGNLKFATNKDTKMVIDTFLVAPNGKLEIGSKADPVKAGVKTEIMIADNGAIDLNWDPSQLSRGLIAQGDVEIHGQAKASHLKVAKAPMAGDNSITLQGAPTNWQVGDRLVLTGTRFIANTQGTSWDEAVEDEEVTIKSINGNTITLNETLQHNHDTPRGDLKAYVANQTRNIVIATENADALPNGQRGHTMFMGDTDIDIRYAEFKDLGRTDKTKRIDNFKDTGGDYPERILDGQGNPIPGARKNITGRYALHRHMGMNSNNPAKIVGNSIDGSPGWGITVHESSAIVENNVAYNIDGGAFVTESGNETGAFRNNISINTGPDQDLGVIEKQGTGTHDFARTGIGFWFQGRLVENENNVAAGSRNTGIFYFHRGVDMKDANINDLMLPGSATDIRENNKVNADKPPIRGFKNNEVFASGRALHVIKNFPTQNSDLRTVMDGLKGWEVEMGTKLQYTAHYTLKDFDLIGSKEKTLWKNKGLELQRNVQDIVFDDMKVSGFDSGIHNWEFTVPDSPSAPPVGERGLIWVDLKLDNNNRDYENFTPKSGQLISSQNIKPGQLSFQPSNNSDLVVNGSDVDSYIDIQGTKTDSLGTIEMPFGQESLSYNYHGAEQVAQQGYYELPDGSRGAIIEEYFSDRMTGDVIKQAFVVRFNENWWTDGAPFLGKLDPSTLGGNKKVTLPQSKYRLNQGPIQPVTPITPTPDDPVEPTPPVTPTDPVTPQPDPVQPDPVEPQPDPVQPDPVQPDPVQPDPVQPDPVQPDPVVPDPVDPTPTPPMKPSDTLKPSLANLKPVAAYDFETGSGGDVKDVSTNGRNNAGELWHGIAWSQGVDGNGVVMDGTGSVRIQNSNDINLGTHRKRSISLWFKADQDSNDGKKQVLYEEGGTTRGVNAYINNDGLLYVGGWNQGGAQRNRTSSWIESQQKVSDGKWHHVALVLDGTNKVKPDALTAYLDGQEIGSDRGSQLLQHSGRIALGNIAGRTRFHDGIGTGNQGLIGSLDEAHIFNQALTGQQVQDLAQQF